MLGGAVLRDGGPESLTTYQHRYHFNGFAPVAGHRARGEGRPASMTLAARGTDISVVLAEAYLPLPFDLHDGTWSCGIGFPFGAGTPAANPACSSRAYTASVSSQSMNRSFTRLSIAFITAARYMANEG